MWAIQGKFLPIERFATLVPERVLNYCDGPKLFTCRDADGGLCLACWSDEDDETARFVVVPVTPKIVAQVEAGTLSVRSALDQSRCWVVDLRHRDGASVAVVAVDLDEYPADALPQPGVLLRPATEVLTVTASG